MKRFGISFIVAGLLIFILSLVGIFKPEEKYLTTTGTIVNIIEDYDAIDDSTYYTVYINYEANNIDFNNVEYGAYNSSMKIGDEVKVYYSPKDPSHIQAEGYQKVPYITLCASIVGIIVGIVFVVKQ